MKFLKRMYFDVVTFFVYWIARITGHWHSPWTHKKTCYEDILRIKKVIQKGDIILTHTRGEFTTLTIPGYWKHVECYIGDSKSIGAVAPATRKGWLEDLISDTDYYAILRMKDVTEEESNTIVDYFISKIGVFYDLRMNFNNPTKVSCSELGYYAINSARPGYLDLRESGGFDIITPQDFYNAKNKFIVVCEK